MATLNFTELERSTQDGRPIEYYRFILNDKTWYYTTAEVDQDIGAFHFVSAAISAAEISQSGEVLRDALRITTPSWIAPAQIFMTAAPSHAIRVTIGYKHVGSDDLVIGYQGEIQQINFPLPGKAVITCQTLGSTMKREGLRLGWQRSCPYVLYDPLNCKVDKALHKVDGYVLGMDGFTLYVDLATTKPSGHFDRGYLEWSHPIRGIELLAIEEHVQLTTGDWNAAFTLFSGPGELYEGATVMVYPGCSFTPANCQAFNNYDNYGGCPDMPGKSPFDGDPVF